ncbi:MAG: hypothetical protein CL893_04715 [Dehalococcoidia bacterium]|nr:hypothetical protein [Dehalococcoidia bacterium]|tara:strand:+ start:18677 stop:19558 length:882 start_codon:yes stop_codon:yes gene_type:complete
MNNFVLKENIDLLNTLDSGQSFAWQKIIEKENSYRGYFRNSELLVTEKDESIHVEVLNGVLEDDLKERFLYYLGEDPYSLENFNILLEDSVISPVIEKYPRLRILKQEEWECMVGFITSSCSNLERIKYHMRLLRQINNDIFPDPAKTYQIGENRLRELGFGFRAPYIINLAKSLIDEETSIDKLRRSTYEESLNSLVKIKGIGRKVADCILAYSFDKKESFPVDRHVLKGLIRWYKYPKKITPEKASDKAKKKFGNLSSHAQQYIFHRQRLASRADMWGGDHLVHAINNDIN